MKRQRNSSFHRIGDLPCQITDTILMFLSLRDMVKTSVLSRSWRYRWAKVPQLLFQDNEERLFRTGKDTHNLNIVFGVLLQHEGPIWKFELDMRTWCGNSGIGKIIHLLSKHEIRDLAIYKSDIDCYTLPSSIFHCVELTHLRLTAHIFKPLALDVFCKLILLELREVALEPYVSISSCPLLETLRMEFYTNVDHFDIDAPNLKTLELDGSISNIRIINTPLLKDLSFSGDGSYGNKSTFDVIKLLYSLPLLENLLMFNMFLELLATSIPENNLPAVLKNLKRLELTHVAVNDKKQLASTLWLIRNSPNLQQLKFELPETSKPEFELGLKIQNYPDYYLMKLQKVEVSWDFDNSFGYRIPIINFLKFILVISPELENFCIKPLLKFHDEKDHNMLMELACHRRASPKAAIVFEDL